MRFHRSPGSFFKRDISPGELTNNKKPPLFGGCANIATSLLLLCKLSGAMANTRQQYVFQSTFEKLVAATDGYTQDSRLPGAEEEDNNGPLFGFCLFYGRMSIQYVVAAFNSCHKCLFSDPPQEMRGVAVIDAFDFGRFNWP